MDRRCCQGLIFGILLVSFGAMAKCPMADFLRQKGAREDELIYIYQHCALEYNDDESQLYLAHAFESQDQGFTPDPESALYFYQLAAESGNAEAQLELAKRFMAYDQTPEQRDTLLKYQQKLQARFETDSTAYRGEFLHPYALLSLAAEPVQKKWYYPTSQKSAPAEAQSLLKGLKLSEARQKQALQQASKWKSRKLLAVAHEVLPMEEYESFVGRLKSADSQQQALIDLEKRTKEYIQQQKKWRSNE